MPVDYIEKALQASAIDELWRLLINEMSHYGFDRLLYGFTYNRRASSLGDRRDMLILSNHNSGYTNHFINDGLFFDAPLTKWALGNNGLRSWSLIDSIRDDLSPRQQEILAFNRKHGVNCGLTISFPEVKARRKGAIGLTAKPGTTQSQVDEIIAKHGREILVINQVTHLKLTSLPFAGNSIPLTKRQRETLEWVGDGYTTQETADHMGLTQATVEKHLRLARENLSVNTTAQAITKASFQNQIYLVDDVTIF